MIWILLHCPDTHFILVPLILYTSLMSFMTSVLNSIFHLVAPCLLGVKAEVFLTVSIILYENASTNEGNYLHWTA